MNVSSEPPVNALTPHTGTRNSSSSGNQPLRLTSSHTCRSEGEIQLVFIRAPERMQLPPLPPLHDSGGQCSRPLPSLPSGLAGFAQATETERERGGDTWLKEGDEVLLSVSCHQYLLPDHQYLSGGGERWSGRLTHVRLRLP